jgi:hypothetical protein
MKFPHRYTQECCGLVIGKERRLDPGGPLGGLGRPLAECLGGLGCLADGMSAELRRDVERVQLCHLA